MNNFAQNRQVWLGIAISIACLVVIFIFIRPADLLAALRTARYGYLIFTAVGLLLFLYLRAVRWRFMLNNDAPFKQIFHIQNIGYMLTMILPLRLGDVARAVLIGNVPPVTVARGISTMLVERLLDMIFMVTVLPFTLAEVGTLPPEFREAVRLFGFAAVLGIVILIIAANQRPFTLRLARAFLNRIPVLDTESWLRRADELLIGLSSLTRLRDGLILAVLSIVVWLPIIMGYHTALLAANLQPTLAMTVLTVCAAAFSVAAPSSPGQIGVFHAGVVFALTAVLNQPEANALSFAILYHALNTITMVLMGFTGLASIGMTFRHVAASARRFANKDTAKL